MYGEKKEGEFSEILPLVDKRFENKQDSELRAELLDRMTEKNLLECIASVNYMTITIPGKEILRAGGWLEYIRETKKEIELDKRTKELTITHLEAEIKSIKAEYIPRKYWWLIGLISLLASGFFSAFFTYLFTRNP